MKSSGYIGRLLAAIAGGFFGWLFGAHVGGVWSWGGLVVGAVLFALLADVRETWWVMCGVWKFVTGYTFDKKVWLVRGKQTLEIVIGLVILSIGFFSSFMLTSLLGINQRDPLAFWCSLAVAIVGLVQVLVSVIVYEERDLAKEDRDRICRKYLTIGDALGPSGKSPKHIIKAFWIMFVACNVFSATAFLLTCLWLVFGIFFTAIPILVKAMALTTMRLASEQKVATGMITTAIGVAVGIVCGKTMLCGGIAAGVSVALLVFADSLAAFAETLAEKPKPVQSVGGGGMMD